MNLFVSGDKQCGMNLATCYSQDSMNQLLVIGGSIGGALALCCFLGIFCAIRSSHIKEREAEKARNRLSLPLTQRPTIRQTTPISFSSPLPIYLMSPVNMLNSTARISGETSAREPTSEYDKCMQYLTKTDQIIQKAQITEHSQV